MSKYDRIPAPLAHVCPKFRPLILQDWNICSSTSSVLSWGLVAFKYSILLWICEKILLCLWIKLDVTNNKKVATRWQSLLTDAVLLCLTSHLFLLVSVLCVFMICFSGFHSRIYGVLLNLFASDRDRRSSMISNKNVNFPMSPYFICKQSTTETVKQCVYYC